MRVVNHLKYIKWVFEKDLIIVYIVITEARVLNKQPLEKNDFVRRLRYEQRKNVLYALCHWSDYHVWFRFFASTCTDNGFGDANVGGVFWIVISVVDLWADLAQCSGICCSGRIWCGQRR